MNDFKKIFLNNKFLFYLILSIFFISKVLVLQEEDVWWDSAVYIGMGKHIYSSGDAGLWEDSRPLVWPIFLGFLWKLNLDVVLFGKLLSLFFSLGVIFMTFIVAREIFDEKVALMAVLLLAITPTFYFFSTVMLTGIVSTFFILIGVYFFIKKSYLLAGIFLGLGFMTRFLQLFAFMVILALFFIYKEKKNFFKDSIEIIIGFSVVTVPYLLLNQSLYGNILHPFSLQLFLSKVTGWMYAEPLGFYFKELFKENYLYVFVVFGLYYLFKEKAVMKKNAILYLIVILSSFFVILEHKEMRFLVVLFPYLFIVCAYGMTKIFKRLEIKFRKDELKFAFLMLFFVQGLIFISISEKSIVNENKYLELKSYISNKDLGNIWITNPIYAIKSDNKIDTLMYYPSFDAERSNLLNSKLQDVDTIFLDTCDILCSPDDEVCSNSKFGLLFNIKEKFNIVFSEEYDDCERFIAVK